MVGDMISRLSKPLAVEQCPTPYPNLMSTAAGAGAGVAAMDGDMISPRRGRPFVPPVRDPSAHSTSSGSRDSIDMLDTHRDDHSSLAGG